MFETTRKAAAMTSQRVPSMAGQAEGLERPIALRPREASKALGICERTLWAKTKSGEIPHMRIGRAVLYPVDLLERWLAEQAQGGVA